MFEGGEHAYAGWLDVPNWYLSTTEDKAFPVQAQRMVVQNGEGYWRGGNRTRSREQAFANVEQAEGNC